MAIGSALTAAEYVTKNANEPLTILGIEMPEFITDTYKTIKEFCDKYLPFA